MASVKSAAKSKKKATAAAKTDEKPARLADYLLARAPAEDIAAYDAADLERAADLAGDARSPPTRRAKASSPSMPIPASPARAGR